MLKEKETRTTVDSPRWNESGEMPASLRQKIEARAYELYLERGATPGHELEDWAKAESEILNESRIHRAA